MRVNGLTMSPLRSLLVPVVSGVALALLALGGCGSNEPAPTSRSLQGSGTGTTSSTYSSAPPTYPTCTTDGASCSCTPAVFETEGNCSWGADHCCAPVDWPHEGTSCACATTGTCGNSANEAKLGFTCSCEYGIPARPFETPMTCPTPAPGEGYCCSFNHACACYAGSGNCAEIGGTPVATCTPDLFPVACAQGTYSVTSCSSFNPPPPGGSGAGGGTSTGGGCDPSACNGLDCAGGFCCSSYCEGNECKTVCND